ncbi:MAG TPA: hypothetical protein VFG14_03540 [Chthoniobacteraceae bacterium]|jgi:hypothetical protein|nr:hypothetical protein [Chthoniobacteraceae bacterium]
MKLLRILLSVAILSAAAAPVHADTNVGTPILAVPFVITKPGKYRFTKPLNHNTSDPAITINSRDVVLDLNGFALSGPKESDDENIGILVNGPNAVIRNGTVRRFHTGFLDFVGAARGTIVEDVICHSQISTAIQFSASDCILRRVIVRDIGTQPEQPEEIFGIRLTGSSIVEHCVIQNIPFRSGLTTNIGLRLAGGSHVIRETDFHRVAQIAVSTAADISTIFERVRIRECGTGLSIAGGQAPLVRDSTIRDCPTSVSGAFDDGGRNILD